MSSERIQNAMDRIDRALARIETQAALATHASAAGSAGNAELVARHEALRESVSSTVSELDALIAGLEK
ncbi:MAG: hypothetical protein AB3N06_05010 [Erythrobacter sp.]